AQPQSVTNIYGTRHAGDGQNIGVAAGDIAPVAQITESLLMPLVVKWRGTRRGHLKRGGGSVYIGNALRLRGYRRIGEPDDSIAAGDAGTQAVEHDHVIRSHISRGKAGDG